MIVATAFIGAQQAVRAIGIAIGGYPNEFDLASKIRSGETLTVPWSFYLYLFIIIILFGLGVFVQTKVMKNYNEMQEENSNKKSLLDGEIELNESK